MRAAIFPRARSSATRTRTRRSRWTRALFGCRLGPKDAYRFAKGEEIMASTGQRVKLSRPLDFLVVSDHSDGFGFFPQLMSGDPGCWPTPQGRKWYDEIQSGKGAQAAFDIITSFGKGQMPKGFPLPGTPAYRSAWQETIKAADEANEPGRFTAFIGYEWTSNDQRQQPAPQRHLPRQRREGQPGRALHHAAAARQPQSPRPVEVDGHVRRENRRPSPRHRAQRQSEQWPHVPDHRIVHRQEDRPRVCREPDALGAALRSDADQGRRRDASLPLAQRRVRQLRALGQGQPRPDRTEEAGDAGVRVCALGLQERPEAGSGARRESLQVRHGRQHRRAHRPRRGRRGQLLRQDLRLRAERRTRHASVREDGQGGPSWAGSRPPPATPRSGRTRTRARPSSTR